MANYIEERFEHYDNARAAGKKGERILQFLQWLEEEHGVKMPKENSDLVMEFYGVDIEGYKKDAERLRELFKKSAEEIKAHREKQEATNTQNPQEPPLIVPGR